MILATVLLAPEPALAAYFVLAWLFNAVAADFSRPATLNSIDASHAWASSRALLAFAIVEGVVARATSLDYGWLLVGLFAAKLMADGILVHLLTPYSSGPLVLEQGATTPPRWVTFHPFAWMLAALLNVVGCVAHLEAAMRHLPMLLKPPAALSLVAFGIYVLWSRVKAALGAWAPRDAAWYAQPAKKPKCTLLSRHVPTFQTYIVASDGTKLAADVWLPCEPGEAAPRRDAPRPTIVHFTPYNRNWRVRANAFGLRLLAKYGVTIPSRLFNTRSLRYLGALVPEGFAFVSVDVRGTGASFGHRACDLLPREVSDLVDVARWVRTQPWCDGWLASGGISYDGMCAMLLAAELPRAEALDAIYPLFSPMGAYEDLCLPGGVPCTGFSDAYAEFRTAGEHDRAPSHAIIGSLGKRLLYSLISGSGDALAPRERRWGLGSLVRGGGGGVAPVVVEGDSATAHAEAERNAAIAEHAHNWDHSEAIRRQRFRDDVMAVVDGGRPVLVADLDPASDARLAALAASGTAVYTYAGWFDSGSMKSSVRLLDQTMTPSGHPRVRCTVGPWSHGLRASCDAHANAGGRTAPRFDMYADIASWLTSVRASMPAGASEVDERVHFFMMGAVDTCRGWRAAPSWPPPNVRSSSMLLCADGELRPSPAVPADWDTVGMAAFEQAFVVEPSATTPRASRWNLVQHILQEAVDYGDRRDATGTVSFTSAPLEAPLAIAGEPCVRLALTLEGGEDACVFAYLEDVPPSASAAVTYVTEGQVRAGFTDALNAGKCAFTSAECRPFVRGTVPIAMQPVAYTFGAGHCVRLSLAGADAANFLPLEGCAWKWLIGVNGPSEVVLPVWGGC